MIGAKLATYLVAGLVLGAVCIALALAVGAPWLSPGTYRRPRRQQHDAIIVGGIIAPGSGA